MDHMEGRQSRKNAGWESRFSLLAQRTQPPAISWLMAQALIAFLQNQVIERDGVETPFFAGAWGIFGHGNVAGLGEALYQVRDTLPTYRAHNEQAMVHSAVERAVGADIS